MAVDMAPPAVAEAPAERPAAPGRLEPGRVVKWGALAGATGVFVSVNGMVVSFVERSVIDPVLGLGYLALLWIPVVFGFQATARKKLEGVSAPKPGPYNLVGGAAAGLIGGVMLALLILLIDSVDLREQFPNISPELLEILTHTGEGEEPAIGFGIVAMIVGGLGLGALGGALHYLDRRVRGAFIAGFAWIITVGLLEVIVGQILREIGLGTVEDFLYSDNRGLTWPAAVIIGVAFAALGYATGGSGPGLRARFSALPDRRRQRIGFITAAVLIVLGAVLPNLLGSFLNEIFATVGLFLLMGLGLNIVVGLAGLLDLGYVAFFAVGAYTTGVLTSPQSPRWTPEMPFWVALAFVVIAAAIAGLVVGTPVIRMRGDYLAIVTLGFGEIVRVMFLSDWLKPSFGGAQGIIAIPGIVISRGLLQAVLVVAAAGLVLYAVWLFVDRQRWMRPSTGPGAAEVREPADTWTSIGVVAFGAAFLLFTLWLITGDEGAIVIQGTNTQAILYMILIFVALAAYVSWRLQDSRVGRAWMAMREDEQVAEAMGINIVRAKLLAFVIGAILASFGGALFAVKIGSIFPSSFALIVSIIVLVLIIVGGMGNIAGVAVGALVLVGILGGPTQPGLLREFEDHKLLIYGALLVYMMLQRPEGLVPSARRTQELHQEEFFQDAWLQQQAKPEPDDPGDPEAGGTT